jgi:voltage-gated potassium channel
MVDANGALSMDVTHDVVHSKFFYVLVSLVLFFLVSPFLTADRSSDFLLSVIFSLFIVVSINASTDNKWILAGTVIFGSLSLISYWDMTFFRTSSGIDVHHYMVNIIFMALITHAVLSTVARQKNVTSDTMFGAISGYLLIGLAWAFIYLTIDGLSSNAFTDHVPVTDNRDLEQHFIYYSFITLTTVGYGDMVANTNIARMFSWMEAVVGQIYLAVWISQLVGLRIVMRTRH